MTRSIEEQALAIAAARWLSKEGRRSWLLELLPAMFAGDDFMNRYLQIYEDTLRPLQQMVENMHYYFNPLTAPREVMEWLATWVNLTLDESWPLEQRRQVVYSATDLYSRRGTKRGLIEYLRLYTGIEADITEYEDGMVLGPQSELGVNTNLAGREGFSFTVTMLLPGLSEEELAYKEAAIVRIIEAEKPAHAGYRLRLITDEKEYVEKITPKARFVGEELTDPEIPDGNGHSEPKFSNILKIVRTDDSVTGAPAKDGPATEASEDNKTDQSPDKQSGE